MFTVRLNTKLALAAAEYHDICRAYWKRHSEWMASRSAATKAAEEAAKGIYTKIRAGAEASRQFEKINPCPEWPEEEAARLNPVRLANRTEMVRWQSGDVSDVLVADYEVYRPDFEVEVDEKGHFVGPDGKIWSENVLGFGRAPALCTVRYVDSGWRTEVRVCVRPEMFCGRI